MDLSELNRLEQRNEVADVLRRAKALIDRPEKWHHGKGAMGYGGSICIGCSIGKAYGAERGNYMRTAVNTPAFALMNRAVPVVADGGGMSVPIYRFNADPQTTHAEVMAAFDRAITLAERQ